MSNAPQPPATTQPARTRRRRLLPLVADAKRLTRLMGVGLRTVRSWDAAGRLPKPVKIGGRTVWLLSELRAWLKAGAPPRGEWEVRKAAARK